MKHHLGLSSRGGNHYNVKRRIEQLALDTSHSTGTGATCTQPWTDADLRSAVAAASSLADVLPRLLLGRDGGMEQRVRRRNRALSLDVAHFTRGRSRSRRSPNWSDEELRTAVASSRSIAEVLRRLELVPAGGNDGHVQRRIGELGIDTRHLTGKGWRKHSSIPTRASIPLANLLVQGRWTGSHALKERPFREGLKRPACEVCGWAEVRSCDGRIPVELDHVNGDKQDNRLENLRVLCPNCHALQPTHRALNRRDRHRRLGGSRRIRTDTLGFLRPLPATDWAREPRLHRR